MALEAEPQLTRRHDLGSGSANSLLLTVLGEFVLPGDRPVWTSTLLAVLHDLGFEEKAIRQALMRTAADGWIVGDRLGRRTQWRLTPAGHSLLSDGTARIYGFAGPPDHWDGRWLLVLVTVPENNRALRKRLRTRLGWAGFGELPPSLWLRPQVASTSPEATGLAAALADLELTEVAHSFEARTGELGTDRDLVRRAWDLDDIEQRYETFIDEVAALRPRTDQQALHCQIRLVQEWRRFPLIDPGLPHELLPRTWSGARAVELFTARHAAWAPRAQRAWEALLEG